MRIIGYPFQASINLSKEIAIAAQAQDSSAVSFVERGAILDKSLASVIKKDQLLFV